MASFFSVPKPLVAFNSKFPLKTYPPIRPTTKNPLTGPTLWIAPPKDGNLSNDVECLKWQAYLALRGVKGVQLRYDVAPEGSLDGVLPNLHVPLAESPLKNVPEVGRPDENGELLPTHGIPGWVDAELGVDSAADPLEGYVNEAARVESRAWVSLLEGVVHAALILSQPQPSIFYSLLFPSAKPPYSDSLQKILSPPPASLTGLCSFIPPQGTRVNTIAILSQYRDAISALSERLGTDTWFLGSSEPTPLDALAFAYLHCLLNSGDTVRIEVTRRVNLVAWEWRVRSLVRDGFVW
ncbi:hypothetical protein D9619_005380 [Psilocybe cf. subviscida]|uniref:Metaxin glutathione S-transferase domain-containing protein n=1 Tax=Psilocybe cf. subviscida TaxID=2480587 RepID=A0A8H5BXQ2_9AGAR|nr:hypothetical protein D9619_005380 [Psilocybe cf. subviscida]